VPSAELRAGRFLAAVERVLGLRVPPPPDLGGAARCARRVLEALEGSPQGTVAPRRPSG